MTDIPSVESWFLLKNYDEVNSFTSGELIDELHYRCILYEGVSNRIHGNAEGSSAISLSLVSWLRCTLLYNGTISIIRSEDAVNGNLLDSKKSQYAESMKSYVMYAMEKLFDVEELREDSITLADDLEAIWSYLDNLPENTGDFCRLEGGSGIKPLSMTEIRDCTLWLLASELFNGGKIDVNKNKGVAVAEFCMKDDNHNHASVSFHVKNIDSIVVNTLEDVGSTKVINSIDLGLSDDEIIFELKNLLPKWRAQTGENEIMAIGSNLKVNEIRKVVSYKILPLVDMLIFNLMFGRLRISAGKMVELLYPKSDISVDTLKKTYMPLALKFMNSRYVLTWSDFLKRHGLNDLKLRDI